MPATLGVKVQVLMVLMVLERGLWVILQAVLAMLDARPSQSSHLACQVSLETMHHRRKRGGFPMGASGLLTQLQAGDRSVRYLLPGPLTSLIGIFPVSLVVGPLLQVSSFSSLDRPHHSRALSCPTWPASRRRPLVFRAGPPIICNSLHRIQ